MILTGLTGYVCAEMFVPVSAKAEAKTLNKNLVILLVICSNPFETRSFYHGRELTTGLQLGPKTA